MINYKELSCRDCGGRLCYYDQVDRRVLGKRRVVTHVMIPRYRCNSCGRIHRILPDYILPFKHYEREIVVGVVEGLIDCTTLGFEDYPCEMTMKRWIDHRCCLESNTTYILE